MRLNIESAMAEDGNSFGISLKKLQEVRRNLIEVQEDYSSAVDAGLIPFSSNLTEKKSQAKIWQKEMVSFDEVWFIGEPSVLQGLQILASDSNLKDKGHWVCSADPKSFASLAGKNNRLLFLLTTAQWGRQLADLFAEQFKKTIVFIGDGTEDSLEPWRDNLELFAEEGCADSRFALFSSLAFSFFSDVDNAVNRFQTQVEGLSRKGMWDNASALLACCFKSIETENNPSQLLLIGVRDSWTAWLQWAEMIWKGMGSVEKQVGALQKQWQGLATGFILGDELGINQLGINSSERLLCLFEEREPMVSNISDQLIEVWNISNLQIEEFQLFAEQRQFPIINLQIQKLSGIELLQLSVSWVHTIMLLNGLRGTNPLAMLGADQWRLFQAAK